MLVCVREPVNSCCVRIYQRLCRIKYTVKWREWGSLAFLITRKFVVRRFMAGWACLVNAQGVRWLWLWLVSMFLLDELL